MGANKNNNIRNVVFLILVLGCAFLGYKTITLSQTIDELKARPLDSNTNASTAKSLAKADSLLVSGNYTEAITQYDNLQSTSSLNVELRKTMSNKLLEMQQRVKQTQVVTTSNDIEIDDTSNTIAETPTAKTIDSLSFALEKAEMQINSVKQQIQQKTFGKYMTFKSSKGNRLHFVGEVKNEKANGFGIAILDSGSRYEGEWQNNQRHGEGTFYWIDGEHYEGTYKNDLRSGQGIYYWTNGEKFIGEWNDDKRNGRGTFYDKDGNVLTSGIWNDDKLVEEDK
ncbi:MORN repeat-containing protein [Psychroserpens sp.]|uniref:MORN repeat-containing protein n=1 Tax=Psychroserpens sp. TaxID=2020870 RepID=UPI003C731200